MRISSNPTYRPHAMWNKLPLSRDMLHRSHSAPCHKLLHQNMAITNLNDVITEDNKYDAMLDINCNTLSFNGGEDSLNHSRLSLTSDIDNTSRRNSCSHTSPINHINDNNKNHINHNNNNDSQTAKRFTKFLQRSDSNPWADDSGFSSCSCLYEDKDDSDNGLTINRNGNLPLPTLRRSRSYSLDSTSSDCSDCSDCNKTLSSSLPACFTYTSPITLGYTAHNASIENTLPTHLTLSNEETSSSEEMKCETEIKLKSRKIEFSNVVEHTSSSSSEKQKSAKVRRSKSRHRSALPRTGNDVNNNRTSSTPTKKLDNLAPHRLIGVFQTNGLLALVGCIVYTLGIVFLLGCVSIVWALLSRFVSPSDLKELAIRDDGVGKHRRSDLMARSVTESARTGVDIHHTR